MYVCVCNAVTDTMIRQAAAEGVRSLGELKRHTGCASACGSCADFAEEVLAEARGIKRFALPVLQAA
ncbi:MAG: (2Fe-2S)-binding protein [Rudaea sp.]